MRQTLVAYFSASGVTKKVASSLAEAMSADLFEIKPVSPYTSADLNWRDQNSRSSLEMKDKSFRPPIAEECENAEDYDTLFVGFPIWWYVAPTIINTFLESIDTSNKRIILFATSGSSGFGNTVKELKPSVSATTKLVEGKILNGKYTPQKLASWANEQMK